jgi:hypothetical protein
MPALKMTNSERLNYLFSIMGRTLALCCHREVGNLPALSRGSDPADCRRPELA